jgi:ribosomal protein S18 acetylase RimI-like enzyme
MLGNSRLYGRPNSKRRRPSHIECRGRESWVSPMIRPAEPRDIPAMAVLRSYHWETAAFWEPRVENYLFGSHSPQKALPERAAFVAEQDSNVVGFVAGHLTSRHQCEGELQWINVAPDYRGRGIAGALLVVMAEWFSLQNARRICVDVVPENIAARGLYSAHGAVPLNPHWMVWEDITKIAANANVSSGAAPEPSN